MYLRFYTLFFTVISLTIISCDQSGPQHGGSIAKVSKPYDPLSGLPESQKKVVLAFKSYGTAFENAPNDIAKDNIQDKFNTWLKSYLLDTLKGNLKNWAVVVNDVKDGSLSNTNFIYVKFDGYLPTGFEGKHWSLIQEIDTKKTSLYPIIKDLTTDKPARLNAKLVSFNGYDASDFPTDLRMPEFDLSVIKVVQ